MTAEQRSDAKQICGVATEAKPDGVLQPAKSPRGWVLLVDPDDRSREDLSDLLGQIATGTIRATGSAEEARSHVAALADDVSAGVEVALVEVALIDLSVWHTGGDELCRTLRAAHPSVPIPVLALVDSCHEELVDAALEAGVSDLVYRPIRPRELATRLHSAIRARRDRLEGARRERRLAEQSRELLDSNYRLERLVCIDSLTGLANRRHLMNILAGEWGRAMRTGRPLSVLLIDLDLFHDYNELHGHSGGDACLRRVAGLLAEALRRPSDLLGRYGGEEFVAVLPDTDAGGALRVAERLCGEVAKLGLPHEGSSHGVVTTSIGVATGHAHRQVGPEGLLAEADQAMYLAKREGRNRVYPREAPPRPQRFRRRAATGSDRWPSPVWMDPVYADRLPGELARMQRAARRAVKAAELGYLTLVRQLARRLETIARDFQFASVVAMARSLEAAAGRADDVGAQAQSEELRWYLERVPVVYRSRTAEIERLPRVT